MKNSQAVKDEIQNVETTIQQQELEKGKKSSLREKLADMKLCLLYLESNPTEDFLKAEMERIEKKISLRMTDFKIDKNECVTSEYNRLKKEHEAKFEIPKLRSQLRTLYFILS